MATKKTKNIPSDYYVDENQRTKGNTPEVIEETTVVAPAETSNRDYQKAGDITVTDTTITNPIPTDTSNTGENNTNQNANQNVGQNPARPVSEPTNQYVAEPQAVTGNVTNPQPAPQTTENTESNTSQPSGNEDDVLSQTNEIWNNYQQSLADADSEYKTAQSDYEKSLEDTTKAQMNIADLISEQNIADAKAEQDVLNAEIADRQKESETLAEESRKDYDNARRAAILTSLAEFGANIANLAGTTRGGVSAKIDRPRDWMSKAEEIRTTERARRDARNKEIRDLIRQRQLAERKVTKAEESKEINRKTVEAEAAVNKAKVAFENAAQRYKTALDSGKDTIAYIKEMNSIINDLRKLDADTAIKLFDAQTRRINAETAGQRANTSWYNLLLNMVKNNCVFDENGNVVKADGESSEQPRFPGIPDPLKDLENAMNGNGNATTVDSLLDPKEGNMVERSASNKK